VASWDVDDVASRGIRHAEEMPGREVRSERQAGGHAPDPNAISRTIAAPRKPIPSGLACASDCWIAAAAQLGS